MTMKLNQITDQVEQVKEPEPAKEPDHNKTLMRIFVPNFIQNNTFNTFAKRHQYRMILQMLYILYGVSAINTIALLVLWIKVYFWSK